MMKEMMKNTKYKLLVFSVVTLMMIVCCGTKQVYAWSTYTSVEEMKQNMDWWETYTMGTRQQLLIERLVGVDASDCHIMDAYGYEYYYMEDYFSFDENGLLREKEGLTDSGTYYIIVNTYENGELVKGCVQIDYIKLYDMPVSVAALVGSSSHDYSICRGQDFPYPITYTSSDEEIATVDEKGVVTPQIKAGEVTITAKVAYPDQEPAIFIGVLDVTDPVIESVVTVARKETLTVFIPGTSEHSKWYFGSDTTKTSFSSKKCSIEVYGDDEMQCLQLSVTANNKKASQKVTMTVDGKVLTFKIVFSNPKLNKEVLVVKRNKTLSIPATGTKSSSVITCNVSDKNIAQITSNGRVKGKKLGTTWLSVDVDGKTFYVLLVVQKGKMYKVVKYAADQIGVAKYSQARRMDDGYYDCSSLVWRSYKAAGLNIGNTTWALNSDGFANYYYKKGKHYIGKNLKTNKKLKCGDIIIRGKYKKGVAQTYHAELYIGDGYIIEAGDYGVHLSTTVGADIAVRPWP